MEDSILRTVRDFIGGEVYGDAFDSQICGSINSALAKLAFRGLDVALDCHVKDETASWDEITTDQSIQRMVRTYICNSAKLDVDPPANATLVSLLTSGRDEAGWYIQTQLEHTNQR